MRTIIRNANIVNEGKTFTADVLINRGIVEKIGGEINVSIGSRYREINAEGLVLIPGMIDDQVHFREPGFNNKGTIYSESRAAVAGGITSFMEMPNTLPNTLTQELLEQKYTIASKSSAANYSFFMGVNKNNLEEALKTNNETVCGISDDGLYFGDDEGILANHPDFLELLFSKSDSLIALHSEDDAIISENFQKYTDLYQENIPVHFHSHIRSEEACLRSTIRILEIAKRHNNRLHLLHISTKVEADLFDNSIPLNQKRITSEACVHHLWFSDEDYQKLGVSIKWNPSIKTIKDKEGLMSAVNENKIDIIATDHAPHTWHQKTGNYQNSLSGGPLVQHALVTLLELFHEGKISLEKIVEKTSHNVAEIYKIKKRGYIREGYYADLVLLNLNNNWRVNDENIMYKCKWSPFNGYEFKSSISHTFVNGNLVYEKGRVCDQNQGMRLHFSKFR